jgi:glucuronate isomerase
MSKICTSIVKTDTIALSECRDGFWLYDTTRGMNLAMRAKTEQAAFIETIGYYQKRLKDIETNYNDLKQKVDCFVEQFNDTDE